MKDAVIVGAGLAGLRCALTLQREGIDVAVLEASDAPGGRVRTDAVDGFLLDRGFQVLLTAYPEAKRVLDYDALRLKPLKPGALVWHGGRFHRFADPFREPFAALRLATDPVVSFADKFRVAKLRRRVRQGNCAGLFSRPETTALKHLSRQGFSEKMIERFFGPFFGGVFLERELTTSSRYFEFLFRMFASGTTAVPEQGMQSIPSQMAAGLKHCTITTQARVTGLAQEGRGFQVCADNLPELHARAIILATAEPESRKLLCRLQGSARESAPVVWNQTTTLYFAAEKSPVEEPILMLNGEGSKAGPVNHAVVMSEVSKAYVPPGSHLIAASMLGKAPCAQQELAKLEQDVRQQVKQWLGQQVDGWRFLRGYPIAHALPMQTTALWEMGNVASDVEGVFVCGDYVETSSIQGALISGLRAAEAVTRWL